MSIVLAASRQIERFVIGERTPKSLSLAFISGVVWPILVAIYVKRSARSFKPSTPIMFAPYILYRLLSAILPRSPRASQPIMSFGRRGDRRVDVGSFIRSNGELNTAVIETVIDFHRDDLDPLVIIRLKFLKTCPAGLLFTVSPKVENIVPSQQEHLRDRFNLHSESALTEQMVRQYMLFQFLFSHVQKSDEGNCFAIATARQIVTASPMTALYDWKGLMEGRLPKEIRGGGQNLLDTPRPIYEVWVQFLSDLSCKDFGEMSVKVKEALVGLGLSIDQQEHYFKNFYMKYMPLESKFVLFNGRDRISNIEELLRANNSFLRQLGVSIEQSQQNVHTLLPYSSFVNDEFGVGSSRYQGGCFLEVLDRYFTQSSGIKLNRTTMRGIRGIEDCYNFIQECVLATSDNRIYQSRVNVAALFYPTKEHGIGHVCTLLDSLWKAFLPESNAVPQDGLFCIADTNYGEYPERIFLAFLMSEGRPISLVECNERLEKTYTYDETCYTDNILQWYISTLSSEFISD